MDRQIVYPGTIPLETDLLNAQKDALVALAMACQAVLGTATVVDGLACAPTTPASLSVNIGPGSIYSQAVIDGSAYSSLAADSRTIVKQGISLNTTTLSFTPPGTVGYSQNFLIEVAYLDQDGGSTVLPYYNASNPSVAYSGPANAGTAQYTTRQGLISIQTKAGVAAASGTQTTPSVDAGYTALYVVTLAYGATSISAGNISTVSTAPFLTPKLPALPGVIQAQAGNYAADSGTANAYVATLSPAPAALTAGLTVRLKIANANTGASTLNVNGLGVVSIKRADGSAVQAGDMQAGEVAQFVYDGTNFQLTAVSLPSSFPTPVGSPRNLFGKYASGTTATWTADEIVVKTALGGQPYVLSSFNKTLNMATNGAGGLDTGTIAASNFYYVYAIYNPSTNTQSILATLSAGAAPSVYGGANMPSGYTASALIGAFATASSQIKYFTQVGNQISITSTTVFTGGVLTGWYQLSVGSIIPPAAKSISGILQVIPGTSANASTNLAGDLSNSSGLQGVLGNVAASTAGAPYNNVPITVASNIFYEIVGGTGTTGSIYINGYTIF